MRWLRASEERPEDKILDILEAILLGVVQGLTEFLPVSSSGHLLLGQYLLGVNQERFGLSFDAAIHTGTVVAVISAVFRRELLGMVNSFLRSLPRPDFSAPKVWLAYLMLVATVPAALIGFLFEDFFAKEARSPWVVVFNLVLVGMLILVAENVGRKSRKASRTGPAGAFAVGIAGLRLGTWRLPLRSHHHFGVVPWSQARGGGPFLVPDERAHHHGGSGTESGGCNEHRHGQARDPAVPSGVALGSGRRGLAIRFLLRYLTRYSLAVFAYYTFALAVVVAALLLSGS
jgi:undecaprenyl-diphosphatase